MKVLAISTSTPRGSAAIVRDDGASVEATYADLQGHAERLFESIDSALARAGASRATLDAVACDVGPGSFTGVRVGVASGKGIALALGIPLAGVVSLEAMAMAAFAEGAAAPDDVVIAAIDAKKSEIFLAAYRASGDLVLAPCARPLAPEAFLLPEAPAGARLVAVGEIAAGLALPDGVRLARGPALDLPDAAWIGRLALRRLAAGADGDPEIIEPLYVRAPDATPMAAV
ncbi:MAG: tRNA (adenosine(37)-N6)-threonylcarbamoyltransferase complex dimerization subunit type 1 TsaB [Minicystis sp.]